MLHTWELGAASLEGDFFFSVNVLGRLRLCLLGRQHASCRADAASLESHNQFAFTCARCLLVFYMWKETRSLCGEHAMSKVGLWRNYLLITRGH